MARKPFGYWTTEDLRGYRDERHAMNRERLAKAKTRLEKATAELEAAEDEAKRMEKGKARWDNMWPLLLEAEKKMVIATEHREADVLDKYRTHEEYMRQMKKFARGVE